jgi:hypothetical protein
MSVRKHLRVAIVGYGTGGQASALMLIADGAACGKDGWGGWR